MGFLKPDNGAQFAAFLNGADNSYNEALRQGWVPSKRDPNQGYLGNAWDSFTSGAESMAGSALSSIGAMTGSGLLSTGGAYLQQRGAEYADRQAIPAGLDIDYFTNPHGLASGIGQLAGSSSTTLVGLGAGAVAGAMGAAPAALTGIAIGSTALAGGTEFLSNLGEIYTNKKRDNGGSVYDGNIDANAWDSTVSDPAKVGELALTSAADAVVDRFMYKGGSALRGLISGGKQLAGAVAVDGGKVATDVAATSYKGLIGKKLLDRGVNALEEGVQEAWQQNIQNNIENNNGQPFDFFGKVMSGTLGEDEKQAFNEAAIPSFFMGIPAGAYEVYTQHATPYVQSDIVADAQPTQDAQPLNVIAPEPVDTQMLSDNMANIPTVNEDVYQANPYVGLPQVDNTTADINQMPITSEENIGEYVPQDTRESVAEEAPVTAPVQEMAPQVEQTVEQAPEVNIEQKTRKAHMAIRELNKALIELQGQTDDTSNSMREQILSTVAALGDKYHVDVTPIIERATLNVGTQNNQIERNARPAEERNETGRTESRDEGTISTSPESQNVNTQNEEVKLQKRQAVLNEFNSVVSSPEKTVNEIAPQKINEGLPSERAVKQNEAKLLDEGVAGQVKENAPSVDSATVADVANDDVGYHYANRYGTANIMTRAETNRLLKEARSTDSKVADDAMNRLVISMLRPSFSSAFKNLNENTSIKDVAPYVYHAVRAGIRRYNPAYTVKVGGKEYSVSLDSLVGAFVRHARHRVESDRQNTIINEKGKIEERAPYKTGEVSAKDIIKEKQKYIKDNQESIDSNDGIPDATKNALKAILAVNPDALPDEQLTKIVAAIDGLAASSGIKELSSDYVKQGEVKATKPAKAAVPNTLVDGAFNTEVTPKYLSDAVKLPEKELVDTLITLDNMAEVLPVFESHYGNIISKMKRIMGQVSPNVSKEVNERYAAQFKELWDSPIAGGEAFGTAMKKAAKEFNDSIKSVQAEVNKAKSHGILGAIVKTIDNNMVSGVASTKDFIKEIDSRYDLSTLDKSTVRVISRLLMARQRNMFKANADYSKRGYKVSSLDQVRETERGTMSGEQQAVNVVGDETKKGVASRGRAAFYDEENAQDFQSLRNLMNVLSIDNNIKTILDTHKEALNGQPVETSPITKGLFILDSLQQMREAMKYAKQDTELIDDIVREVAAFQQTRGFDPFEERKEYDSKLASAETRILKSLNGNTNLFRGVNDNERWLWDSTTKPTLFNEVTDAEKKALENFITSDELSSDPYSNRKGQGYNVHTIDKTNLRLKELGFDKEVGLLSDKLSLAYDARESIPEKDKLWGYDEKGRPRRLMNKYLRMVNAALDLCTGHIDLENDYFGVQKAKFSNSHQLCRQDFINFMAGFNREVLDIFAEDKAQVASIVQHYGAGHPSVTANGKRGQKNKSNEMLSAYKVTPVTSGAPSALDMHFQNFFNNAEKIRLAMALVKGDAMREAIVTHPESVVDNIVTAHKNATVYIGNQRMDSMYDIMAFLNTRRQMPMHIQVNGDNITIIAGRSKEEAAKYIGNIMRMRQEALMPHRVSSRLNSEAVRNTNNHIKELSEKCDELAVDKTFKRYLRDNGMGYRANDSDTLKAVKYKAYKIGLIMDNKKNNNASDIYNSFTHDVLDWFNERFMGNNEQYNFTMEQVRPAADSAGRGHDERKIKIEAPSGNSVSGQKSEQNRRPTAANRRRIKEDVQGLLSLQESKRRAGVSGNGGQYADGSENNFPYAGLSSLLNDTDFVVPKGTEPVSYVSDVLSDVVITKNGAVTLPFGIENALSKIAPSNLEPNMGQRKFDTALVYTRALLDGMIDKGVVNKKGMLELHKCLDTLIDNAPAHSLFVKNLMGQIVNMSSAMTEVEAPEPVAEAAPDVTALPKEKKQEAVMFNIDNKTHTLDEAMTEVQNAVKQNKLNDSGMSDIIKQAEKDFGGKQWVFGVQQAKQVRDKLSKLIKLEYTLNPTSSIPLKNFKALQHIIKDPLLKAESAKEQQRFKENFKKLGSFIKANGFNIVSRKMGQYVSGQTHTHKRSIVLNTQNKEIRKDNGMYVGISANESVTTNVHEMLHAAMSLITIPERILHFDSNFNVVNSDTLTDSVERANPRVRVNSDKATLNRDNIIDFANDCFASPLNLDPMSALGKITSWTMSNPPNTTAMSAALQVLDKMGMVGQHDDTLCLDLSPHKVLAVFNSLMGNSAPIEGTTTTSADVKSAIGYLYVSQYVNFTDGHLSPVASYAFEEAMNYQLEPGNLDTLGHLAKLSDLMEALSPNMERQMKSGIGLASVYVSDSNDTPDIVQERGAMKVEASPARSPRMFGDNKETKRNHFVPYTGWKEKPGLNHDTEAAKKFNKIVKMMEENSKTPAGRVINNLNVLAYKLRTSGSLHYNPNQLESVDRTPSLADWIHQGTQQASVLLHNKLKEVLPQAELRSLEVGIQRAMVIQQQGTEKMAQLIKDIKDELTVRKKSKFWGDSVDKKATRQLRERLNRLAALGDEKRRFASTHMLLPTEYAAASYCQNRVETFDPMKRYTVFADVSWGDHWQQVNDDVAEPMFKKLKQSGKFKFVEMFKDENSGLVTLWGTNYVKQNADGSYSPLGVKRYNNSVTNQLNIFKGTFKNIMTNQSAGDERYNKTVNIGGIQVEVRGEDEQRSAELLIKGNNAIAPEDPRVVRAWLRLMHLRQDAYQAEMDREKENTDTINFTHTGYIEASMPHIFGHYTLTRSQFIPTEKGRDIAAWKKKNNYGDEVVDDVVNGVHGIWVTYGIGSFNSMTERDRYIAEHPLVNARLYSKFRSYKKGAKCSLTDGTIWQAVKDTKGTTPNMSDAWKRDTLAEATRQTQHYNLDVLDTNTAMTSDYNFYGVDNNETITTEQEIEAAKADPTYKAVQNLSAFIKNAYVHPDDKSNLVEYSLKRIVNQLEMADRTHHITTNIDGTEQPYIAPHLGREYTAQEIHSMAALVRRLRGKNIPTNTYADLANRIDKAGAQMIASRFARHRMSNNHTNMLDMIDAMDEYLNSISNYWALTPAVKAMSSALFRVTGREYDQNVRDKGTTVYNLMCDYIDNIKGRPRAIDAFTRKLSAMIAREMRKLPILSNLFGDYWLPEAIEGAVQLQVPLKLGMYSVASGLAQVSQLFNVATIAGMPNFVKALKVTDSIWKDMLVSKDDKGKLTFAGGDFKIGKFDPIVQEVIKNLGLTNQSTSRLRMNAGDFSARHNVLDVLPPVLKHNVEKSMIFFRMGDVGCRVVGAQAGVYKMEQDKEFQNFLKTIKDEDERKQMMVDYVEDFVNMTNFNFNRTTDPLALAKLGRIGHAITQFSKFGLATKDFLVYSCQNHKQRAKLLGYMALFSGLTQAIPAFSFFSGMMALFGVGDPEEWVKKRLMEAAGRGEIPKQVAEAAGYGILAPLLGVDISKKIGYADMFRDPSDKHSIFGPAVGSAIDLAAAMQATKDWIMTDQLTWDEATFAWLKQAPQWANWFQAAMGTHYRYSKFSNKDEYQSMRADERFKKSIGFADLKYREESDISRYLYSNNQEFSDAVKKAQVAYINNPSPENLAELQRVGKDPNKIKTERFDLSEQAKKVTKSKSEAGAKVRESTENLLKFAGY